MASIFLKGGALPVIPTELLNILPVQLMSIALFLIILVWLFKAVQGILSSIAGWRKDETGAAAKLRTERAEELRASIAAARDARQAEARWYGQWVEINEELRNKTNVLADLGKVKDALERDNIQLRMRLHLYEAFLDSDVISSETRTAWGVFRKMSDAAKRRADDTDEADYDPAIGRRRLPREWPEEDLEEM